HHRPLRRSSMPHILQATRTHRDLQVLSKTSAALPHLRSFPTRRSSDLDIVEATRDHAEVQVGASTRAALSLYRAAQALALAEGRADDVPADIKRLASAVLPHRLLVQDDVGAALGEGEGRSEEHTSELQS